jgi:hypothetical protein
VIRFVSEDWKEALTRSAAEARIAWLNAENDEDAKAALRKVRAYNARLKDISALDASRGECLP